MSFKRFKTALYVMAASAVVFSIAIISMFAYLMATQPAMIPTSETFGSFWLKNFSLVLAALAFVASALTAAWNSIEQRHLRHIETYPYIELIPFLSVDPFALPVPRAEVPAELSTFNKDYLNKVAPGQQPKDSDTDFRFFGLAIRNVGHGTITKVHLEGYAEVPESNFPSRKFTVKRRFNLQAGHSRPFTLLPIDGLPKYRVRITSLVYHGHFVEMKDFEGAREYSEGHPYIIPSERRDTLFVDEFENPQVGLGWILDFWGTWGPTSYMHVPIPSGNDHFLVMRGDQAQFQRHHQNRGGAFRDFPKYMAQGQTVQVTARVRSLPETTATIQLWCHDSAVNPKNRYSRPVTPDTTWEDLTMLYTASNTADLRVHLLYTPGAGEIQVDRVVLEGLHT